MLSAKIEIGAEIRSRRGRVLKRYPFQECHSLLKGFIQILYTQMAHNGAVIKDIDGIMQTGSSNTYNLSMACTSQTNWSIVIGTGTTVVTITDWKLASQITSNIVHQTPTFAVENPDSSTWRLAISRGFTNNTGAVVNVKEVGGIGSFKEGNEYVLLDRTLYDVSFQTGETLTLTYRITISL